jgi:hypothetical protein
LGRGVFRKLGGGGKEEIGKSRGRSKARAKKPARGRARSQSRARKSRPKRGAQKDTSIQSIIEALKFYQTIILKDEATFNDSLCDFSAEHTRIIDDYIAVLHTHVGGAPTVHGAQTASVIKNKVTRQLSNQRSHVRVRSNSICVRA